MPRQSFGEVCRALLRRGEVNRAVAYLVVSRGWQFLSGFLTVYLLTKHLPKEAIGVYSAFANQLGVQLFVELGLPGIVAILASHEWADLELDSAGAIRGNPRSLSRLAGLQRFADRWFLVAAAAFILFAAGVGTWNLASSPTGAVIWQWPWIGSVLTSGLCLPHVSRIAILEGCNQVDRVNLTRLYQSVVGSLVVWMLLVSGAGLWAIAGSNLVRWVFETWLIRGHYRSAFQSLAVVTVNEPVHWRREIWPLQWRVAIQTVGSYFSTFFFQPLVLRLHGGVAAGRFGMTWQVLNTLHTVSFSWINTRMAELGVLASRGEHELLRHRLRKTGLIGLAVFLLGSVSYCLTVEGLRHMGYPMAENFLPTSESVVLILGLAGVLVATIGQTSVRLYKLDPFLIANVTCSLLMAVSASFAVRWGGTGGLALAYTGLVWAFTIPTTLWLVRRYRPRSAGTPGQPGG